MTNLSQTVIKCSNFLGRPVLERNTAEKVGQVSQLWLDPKNHQILGFLCTSGFLGLTKRGFNWSHIESIGPQGIIVSAPDDLEIAKPPSVEYVLGDELWTDKGSQVGVIADYRFDVETGDVVDYLFTADGWGGLTNGVYGLAPEAVISMNGKRVIAADAAVQGATLVAAGFMQRVFRAKDYLQDDLERTKADVSKAMQGTQTIATNLKETAQKATEQAKDVFSDKASHLQQTVQETTGQTKDSLMDLTDQMRERAKQAAAEARERFAAASTQGQESMQTALEQVKENVAGLADQMGEFTQRGQPEDAAQHSETGSLPPQVEVESEAVMDDDAVWPAPPPDDEQWKNDV